MYCYRLINILTQKLEIIIYFNINKLLVANITLYYHDVCIIVIYNIYADDGVLNIILSFYI